MREIKSKKERQKEILDAAKAIFLEKGFEKTTMEETVAKTSLSKGGVYYYYSNTLDILHDLMIEGMLYRMKIIQSSFFTSQEWDDDTFAEMLVDKMTDESEWMSLYVIYLQASQRNPALRALFTDLKEENQQLFAEELGEKTSRSSQILYSDFMLALMNSIILGAEILFARETYREHRALLKEMVILCLQRLRKE